MRTYDDKMFIDTFEHSYTWLNGFKRNVNRFADRLALIDPERNISLTYKQLDCQANRLASALQKDGLGKNDLVMTALYNSPEFAISYIGPRKIGAIMLAANFNLASGEMTMLIDHNKPKVLIYSAAIRDVVIESVLNCKYKPGRLVMADNIRNIEVAAGHISYEDYVQAASPSEPDVNFRPHIYDEVLRLCTSGTTALPKCVPINDINEVLSAHDVIMHYPLDFHDVTLNLTPWFHRGGCHSGGPGPIFYVGGTVLVMRNFLPQTALEWVSKYSITFMMGAPANLELLSQAQQKKSFDLKSLKGIVTMGGPLSKADCIRYMKVLTPNIFNGYGTTESFWNSFLRPFNLPEKAGSAGGSCLDDEVRLVKLYDNKRAEPDDTVPKDSVSEGEIIIFSPGKTTYSYYNNEEMAKEKFYKGWLYTGDVGTWDSLSFVTIKGRKDDMMVVSGENIYPSQVEEVILESPRVKDCIVTSVEDRLRGQAVCAYIVPEDKSVTIEEISSFCKNSPLLSKYKRPRYFALIDDIPLSATGKKRHSQMKKRSQADLASGLLRKAVAT